MGSCDAQGQILTYSAATQSILPTTQSRTLFDWLRPKRKDVQEVKGTAPANSILEEVKKPKKGPTLVRGDLASSSIFEDEAISGPKPKSKGVVSEARNPHTMSAALDPTPMARMRWERKMVIRDMQNRGRLTKAQILKKTERELQSKSHNFATSLKKLFPIANQIAGKTVEEAIVQMRFSKKKAARDVKEHLEHARNEAIVRRGMGLGAAKNKGQPGFHPVEIKTKDGKRVKVDEPTRLYVDQAWVGKGDYGITPDHRARGQIHRMHNPSTRTYRPSIGCEDYG